MVTFLHTADWQIGMTRHWLRGEAQARYDDARLEAIRALGRVAGDEHCDFVVVCGDVFEANQLAPRTVLRALEALREVPVPVYLLPGNHDPLDALSIYRSPQFRQECPDHVHVLDTPGPVPVGEGVELVAAPWTSKHPGTDLVAEAVARSGQPDGTVRIVVGHGAVDVLDPDRDNRAAIRLDSLEAGLAQGRLHYVALGDRHSRTSVGGSGRVWYSGTPEVTDPREANPGEVLVVRLEASGTLAVEPRRVGTWDFRILSREVNGHAGVDALDSELEALPRKDRTVVRLALRGVLSLPEHARLEQVLARHAELLAALVRWERHTRLTLVDDGAAGAGAGPGGYVSRAAEEMRELAAAEPDPLEEVEPEGEAIADDDTEGAAVSIEDVLAWSYDPSGPPDGQSSREALGLLYQLTAEARR